MIGPLTSKCPICGSKAEIAFEHEVLAEHNASYELCSSCEFIAVRPANWLADAYGSALAATDTGAVARSEALSRVLVAFAILSGIAHERGLDVGGAHGLLVRMLRDRGLDFRWSDAYAKNLFARGFEDDGGHYAWVTLIEVFEHLVSPFEFFDELVRRCSPSCVVFTTLLKESLVPQRDWWYWSFETGQHIGFASAQTLEVLARRLGYRFVTAGSIHLFYKERRHAHAFRLAATRLSRPIAAIARAKLGSLTLDDHHKLARTLKR